MVALTPALGYEYGCCDGTQTGGTGR